MDFMTAKAVLSFTIGSTTYYLSSEPVASAPFQTKVCVTSFGSFTRKVSGRDGLLEPISFQVAIADTDNTFKTIMEGSYGPTMKGTATTLTVYDASGNSSVRFTGIIDKKPTVREDGTVTFSLGSDHRKLKRGFMHHHQRANWANADHAALHEFVPVVYGSQLSQTEFNDKGMAPCAYIDTTLFRYYVQAGWSKSVPRVFQDEVVTGGTFSITNPKQGGRRVTLVDFTTTRGTSAISVDMLGVEPVGDGSGTVITNGVTITKHVLDNLVYGDYQRGAWLSGNAPIDTTSWTSAETWTGFTNNNFVCMLYLGGKSQKTGIDVLAVACKNMLLRCFWKSNGTIALIQEENNYLNTDLYKSSSTQYLQSYVFESFVLEEDDSQCVNRVQTRYQWSESQGKFLGSLQVFDSNVDTFTSLPLDLYMIGGSTSATAAINAREIASKTLRLYRLPWSMVTGTVTMNFAANELMDVVNISHEKAPWGSSFLTRRPFIIMEITEDWNKKKLIFKMRDLKTYAVNVWDSCIPQFRTAETYGSGRARIANYTGSYFDVRSTAAYVTSPQDEIAAVAIDDPKNDKEGVVSEPTTSNSIINSSFKNGVGTSWIKISAAAATDDTVDNMFENTGTSGQSCKLTAPSPLSAGDGIQQGSITGTNSYWMLVVDHKDDSNQPLTWSVQRGVDSLWWRDSDSSWQAGEQFNTFPVSQNVPARHCSKPIAPGAAPGNLAIRLRARTAANQINHIYHVNFGDNSHFRQTRLVTDAVVVNGAGDLVRYNMSSIQTRMFSFGAGSYRAIFRPNFTTSEMTNAALIPPVITLWKMVYDANNFAVMYCDTTAGGTLYFRVKAGGVTSTASMLQAFVRDTNYKIGAKWDGTTIWVYCDGSSGSTTSAAMTPVYPANLYAMGSDSSSDQACGHFRAYEFLPILLSDADFNKSGLLL